MAQGVACLASMKHCIQTPVSSRERVREREYLEANTMVIYNFLSLFVYSICIDFLIAEVMHACKTFSNNVKVHKSIKWKLFLPHHSIMSDKNCQHFTYLCLY
jgi:hypothetical protein